MSLIRTLKERKEEIDGDYDYDRNYAKADINFFIIMQEDVKELDSYCFAGYYNANHTKIKDVLTGEIYTAPTSYTAKCNNNFYARLDDIKYSNGVFSLQAHNPTGVNSNLCSICIAEMGPYFNLFEFFEDNKKVISHSKISAIVSDIDTYMQRAVKNHLEEKEKALKEQAEIEEARKGYDINF